DARMQPVESVALVLASHSEASTLGDQRHVRESRRRRGKERPAGGCKRAHQIGGYAYRILASATAGAVKPKVGFLFEESHSPQLRRGVCCRSAGDPASDDDEVRTHGFVPFVPQVLRPVRIYWTASSSSLSIRINGTD